MTKLYGASDDLIECEGDVAGEVGCYKSGDSESGALVAFDDGTIVDVKYGKPSGGIWAITVLAKGRLFDRVEVCDDDEDDPYSDVLYLKPGAKRAWVGTSYEPMR